MFDSYLPKWVIEAKLFPPSPSKDFQLPGFQECWIVEKKVGRNKLSYLKRKSIENYFGISEQIRVLSCFHKQCINPTHLIKQKLKLNPEKKKQAHPNAKLSIAEVKEIKRLLFNSELTSKEIAKQFNVCPMTISLILSGKIWKNF
ncbi:MAG: hypothetical protein RLZZ338_2980 [Cyanobacteriota bacterium]|jgi:hypothetical protein